jgi:hypothetical protein
MGFKSQRLPMIEVRRAMQGNNCLAFEPKKGYPSKFSKGNFSINYGRNKKIAGQTHYIVI